MVWGINSYMYCGQVFTSCGFDRSFSTLHQIIIGRPAARFAIVYLWKALAFRCVCLAECVYVSLCVFACLCAWMYFRLFFSVSVCLFLPLWLSAFSLPLRSCQSALLVFFSVLIFLILFLHPISNCFNLFRSLSWFLSTSPH